MARYTYIQKSLLTALVISILSISWAWAASADFKVNDDGGTAPQVGPEIAVMPGGEFLVAWQDRRLGRQEIFHQRFTESGSPLGRNALLSQDSISAEGYQVALDNAFGYGYRAVWKDFRNGQFPFNPDLYLAAFDSVWTSGSMAINLTANEFDSVFEEPDIATLPDGRSVVVWAQHDGSDWDVHAQILTPSGQVISSFQVNTDTALAQQHAPRVSASLAGWFVVTWYDNRNGNDDIFMRIYDATGSPQGNDRQANIDSRNTRQAFPVVACDGRGRFTLSWVDWRNGAYPENPDIFARQYNVDGTAIDSSFRVNLDNTTAAQKDVAIASDRLGNVAIVWADSSSGNWNIISRLIDNFGIPLDTSFIVNQDTVGRQVQPDVTMDGFDMRAVWADMRNGNFDVYGRVLHYNSPALQANPKSLTFNMHTSGPSPAPKVISLINAGLGALDYRLIENTTWLQVSPLQGQAPDDITFTISVDSMPVGTYQTTVNFIDETINDSSGTINVTLNVTTSHILPDRDTVSITAIADEPLPPAQFVPIRNTGSGKLAWSAVSTVPWVIPLPFYGTDDTPIGIYSSMVNATIGSHTGYLVISDLEADNSPDTIVCKLRYLSERPVMHVQPESISVTLNVGDSLTQTALVTNDGESPSSWYASSSATWLTLLGKMGTDNDEIVYTIRTAGLQPGVYNDSILVVDSAAFNGPQSMHLTLTVEPADTLAFESVTFPMGSTIEIPANLHVHDSIRSLHISMSLDTLLVKFDSASLYGLQATHFLQYNYNPLTFRLNLHVEPLGENSAIAPGVHNGFLKLRMKTQPREYQVPTENFMGVDDSIWVIYPSGHSRGITVQHGILASGASTDVNDNPDESPLPTVFAVSQNFPNPFNLATEFRLDLPRSSHVLVRIYNVLGQTVRTLYDSRLSAGRHSFQWDGRTSDKIDAPTGVYLYEVIAGEQRQVRKALLIK